MTLQAQLGGWGRLEANAWEEMVIFQWKGEGVKDNSDDLGHFPFHLVT